MITDWARAVSVAKKKDGKSLFEVMKVDASRGDESINVPSWFDRGERADDEASKIPQPVSPPPVPVHGPVVRHEPILSVSAGRLVISLNQISAVVVVLAIILLVVGAFFLGRRTSQNASASPDRIRAPHNPGATRLGAGPVNVLPGPKTHRSKPDGAGMVPDNAQRKKGYSYLVIQGGIPTPKEARDIKRFLYGKGIDATAHRVRQTGQYKVKDMRGFQDIRSAQTLTMIRDYVAHMERLGKEYQRLGGRYDFKQSSGTAAWMETEK